MKLRYSSVIHIKFFTLLFLFDFLILLGSCRQSFSETVGKAQGDPVQKESQTEKLYTITIRGDLSIMKYGDISVYFINSRSGTDVIKHFNQGNLTQANKCIAFRKSDFPHLSIKWQFNNQTVAECNNSYISTVKCRESAANLFLDLPRKDKHGIFITFPLNLAEKNPEIEKCYKLY